MKKVIEIIDLIAKTSSTKQKEQILKDNAENKILQQVLEYCYNPSKIYGIAKKSLIKPSAVEPPSLDIFSLLDWLQTVNRSNEVVDKVNAFLLKSEEKERELYIKILLKDLRCGISEKTVLKVFPKLFYLHEIQQAYPMKENNQPKANEWFALQEKYNGIRGDYLPNLNSIVSRQGISFTKLDHIIEEIKTLFGNKLVVDGELIRDNKDNLSDEENFTLTCSLVNSDDVDKTDVVFRIYDVIPLEEFLNGQSKLKFKERYDIMMIFEEKAKELGLSHLLFSHNLYEGTDQRKIQELLDKMDEEGKEGLMLYKNEYYKCKRHNGLLKVKSFLSCDIKCIGVYEGEGRNEGKLGGIIVNYKGYEVGCGSGFSDEQREYYWNNQQEIVDRIVQIKYKTESKNKQGGISMQFPIFQCVRELGKEESYN